MLCQECKENYHNPKYKHCYYCHAKDKPELEKYLLKEYEHPYCRKKIKMLQEDWEFLSPFNLCLDYCDTYPPDCEIFMKKEEEIENLMK